MKPCTRLVIALVAMGSIQTAGAETPTPRVVSYQGQLKLSTGPVNESCDFVFSLYDAAMGGTMVGQFGTTLAPRVIAVDKGLFTVPLEFGATAFNGHERWLEVQVRLSAQGGAFTTLTPRQCITPSAQAIHALTGGDYVGTLQEAYNKGGPGAGRTINTDSGPLSLTGSGGLQVQGPIHSVAGGIKFPDGSIQMTAASGSGNPVLGIFWDTDGTNTWVTGGNVGIGTTTPSFDLDVDGDARVLGTLIADFISSQSPLELQTSGVTRVLIDDPSGFVGIGTGTDTPISLLHLGSDDDLSLTLDMDRDGAGNDGVGRILFGTTGGGGFGTQYGEIVVDSATFGATPPMELNGVSANDVLIANGGGNVGIGTMLPAEKLDVTGNIRTDGFIMPTGAANGLVLTSDATGVASWGMPNANPTGPAGGDLAGTYPNPDIAPNAVGSAEIADGSVMTADIANDAVTSGKIADGAITSADIANDSIDNTKLASDAMSLNKVTGGIAQAVGGNIDIPAPGKLLVNFISSHSPLELQTGGVTRVFIDDPSGNVGIGTTTPFFRLHVSSPGFGNTLLESSNVAGTWLDVQNTSAGGTNWQFVSTGSGNGGGPGNLIIGHGPAPNNLAFANIFANSTTNNVGIGNTDALARLHVWGNPIGLPAGAIVDEDLIVEATDARLGLYSLQAGAGGSSITFGEIFGGALVNNWGIIRETTPGGAGMRFTFGLSPDIGANPSLVYFDDNGNVGIGNLAPAVRLHVSGGTDVSPAGGGFLQLGESASTNIGIDNNEIMARNNGVVSTLFLNNEGGNVVVSPGSNSGNFGVGVANPVVTVEVADTQAVQRMFTTNHPNGAVLELFNLTPTPPTPAFLGAVNFYNNVPAAVGQLGYLGTDAMTFRVASLERARIDANGNLGIMTTTPTEKLHVVGNGLFTGSVLTTMVDSNTDGADLNQSLSLKTEGAPHIIIQADGKVGIGSPPPMPVDPDPMVAVEVNGCVKATCFKTPIDTTIEVSSLKLVKAGGATIDLIAGVNGVITARPLAAGTAYALLPVDIISKLLGTDKKLKSIKISYKVASSASFITATHIRSLNDDGTFTTIVSDLTDQTSRSYATYTLGPAMPVVVTGSVFVAFDLNYAGASPTNDISIGRIVVTLAD
ncbi:MAG: hypothetical protein HZA51_10525 [Planctomycetes bacterium]|nr:hypothetical protein [Planctomycetota bacterium]